MVEQTIETDDLGRRENPDYSRVTGLVKRDLARRLRVFVASTETTISEVVEEALQKYLDEMEGERANSEGNKAEDKTKKTKDNT
jgi:predicted DNA-binding protein